MPFLSRFFSTLVFLSSFILSLPVLAETATYRLVVNNNWLVDDHPSAYPEDAHFSWLGGGAHLPTQSFWSFGEFASPGMRQMAETGVTTMLVGEVEQQGGTGINWQYWFCPETTLSNPKWSNRCGSTEVEFEVTDTNSAITLASMLGPSPDWFVGVSALNLRRRNGEWIKSLSVPLALYDGGTEDGETPLINNPMSSPVQPISYIRYDQQTGRYIPTDKPYFVGSFQFSLIAVDGVPIQTQGNEESERKNKDDNEESSNLDMDDEMNSKSEKRE